jgi:hypothetical protein
MKKSELLRALQTEIRRHDFSTFVDTPPSVAQGGNGDRQSGSRSSSKIIRRNAVAENSLTSSENAETIFKHEFWKWIGNPQWDLRGLSVVHGFEGPIKRLKLQQVTETLKLANFIDV